MVTKAFFDAIDPTDGRRPPNVVVVDPQFDAYRHLAASARDGHIGLHFRSSGLAAIKLARRFEVDAWVVGTELDDMSGRDFMTLLADVRGDAKVVAEPITCAELEALVGMPVSERGRRLHLRATAGSWVALPVSVGAAVVALAILMVG
jgi:hypothetical protein